MTSPRDSAADRSLVAITLDAARERREQRRLRVAIAGSFVLHLALLNLTVARDPVERAERAREPQLLRLRDFRLKPPEPAPTEIVPRPQPARRTIPAPVVFAEPVPDPLPAPPPVDPAVELPVLAPPPPPPAPPAEQRSPGPIRFGHGMTRPVRVAGPDPVYTEPARRARIRGVVILEAILDRDGRVTRIEVLKSLPLGLTESAIDAVSRWRFEPATLNGEPVAVFYNLTVRFELD